MPTVDPSPEHREGGREVSSPVPEQQYPTAAAQETLLSTGQLVEAYIKTKWAGAVPCPVCKHDDWTIGDVFDAPVRTEAPQEPGLPVQVYAHVPVICTTCGYTMLFNAVWAGVAEPWSRLLEKAEDDKKRALEAAEEAGKKS